MGTGERTGLTENPAPTGFSWVAGIANGAVLLDKLPFFDKIDSEIGLAAVVYKFPLPDKAQRRSLGDLVADYYGDKVLVEFRKLDAGKVVVEEKKLKK